jgi:hypothetical protein
VKQGWEHILPGDGVVKFSALLEEYCDPKGTISNVDAIVDFQERVVRVRVEYNGEITRCFCPYRVYGAIQLPEEMSGEYNFVLASWLPATGQERVLDSKTVKVRG